MNYNNSIPISDKVYWVGTYDDQDSFQCNSYLIIIDGKGIIIDPGSVIYYENFLRKITERIELTDISYIIIQHQDADVCGNITMLSDAILSAGNNDCRILTHSRNYVLIRHYNSKMGFELTDKIPGEKIIIGPDNELEFIHTPYLHAPGAIATYFNSDKILFSSDIFGGMTDDWDLFAGDTYFDDISNFHEDYMPSKELLLYAMTKFERYDINMIAPQHGSVINREQAAEMIETFKDFDCGLYIDESFRQELQAARKKIEEQNRIMSRDLSMAAHFQQTLLPDTDSGLCADRIDIAYTYKPYSEVSGDFLIIDDIDSNHIGVLIIDVVDHGVMSGLATIQIKTLFDEHKSSSLNPAEVLKIINDKSFSIAENDIFFTALYGIFDLENFRLDLASAGSIPVVYHNAEKNESELIQIPGTSLGVVHSDECRIGEAGIPIKKGDVFILQTDGLMDTTNSEDVTFDHPKSQRNFIEEIKEGLSSQQILDTVIEKAEKHKGRDKGFDDDVTVAVMKILS